MDHGVIQNLKVHYRKLIVLRQLSAIDAHTEFTISLLDAMRLLQQAWQSVTPATIRNCYRHAGFLVSEPATSETADDIDELDDIPLARLAGMGTSSSVLQEFVNFADDDATTSGMVTDEEIIMQTLEKRECTATTSSTDEDDNDDGESLPVPTISNGFNAIAILRQVFESLADTEREASMLCSLSRRLVRENFTRTKSMKQSLIADVSGL